MLPLLPTILLRAATGELLLLSAAPLRLGFSVPVADALVLLPPLLPCMLGTRLLRLALSCATAVSVR